MRIERSMAAYWRNKGKLLCSSCLDRQEMPLKMAGHGRKQGSSEFRANSKEKADASCGNDDFVVPSP